jgi:hypothetical protein
MLTIACHTVEAEIINNSIGHLEDISLWIVIPIQRIGSGFPQSKEQVFPVGKIGEY